MRAAKIGADKPLVVLVHRPSLLRHWMERALEKNYRLCMFSGGEEALAFVRSTPKLDAIVTDLDFGSSDSKGASIARKVRKRFPNAPIFMFATDDHQDPRLLILRNLKGIRFLSAFGAFFIERAIKNALERK